MLSIQFVSPAPETTASCQQKEQSLRDVPCSRRARDCRWLIRTCQLTCRTRSWRSSARTRSSSFSHQVTLGFARENGIEERYDGLKPGQQRMHIGAMLRTRVSSEVYEGL